MPVDLDVEVLSNTLLSGDYNVLALAGREIAAWSSPGQFVMVRARQSADPLLRRPFSLFEIVREPSSDHALATGGESPDRGGLASGVVGFSILNKRIGPSTALLYEARPGQRLSVLGPLGRGFTLVDVPREAWLVAGGVGLAPFAVLAERLRARDVPVTLFYGARRATELFYLDFFRRLGVTLQLTTEDGSLGERGRVIAPLERALASRPLGAMEVRPLIYACGPEGMLSATARTAARYHTPCEVSVERLMGCGMGGCYSCVVPVSGDDGRSHHVRSCLTGPVLAADRIVWD